MPRAARVSRYARRAVPRTRIAAAAVGLALLAAGCGGGDGEDSERFREGYNAAMKRLAGISSEVGGASQSNREIAAEYQRKAGAAERTYSALADLEPPEEAREEFDDLLAALRQGIRDLRAFAKAARRSDRAAARRAVAKLRRTGTEITRAEEAVKQAVEG
jgi:hypothetical protein